MSYTKTQYRVTYRTEYTTKVATTDTWLPCTVVTDDLVFAEFLMERHQANRPTRDARPTEYRLESRTVTYSDWSPGDSSSSTITDPDDPRWGGILA